MNFLKNEASPECVGETGYVGSGGRRATGLYGWVGGDGGTRATVVFSKLATQRWVADVYLSIYI